MSDAADDIGRALDVVDLVADGNDADPEAVAIELLSRVRKRGAN